MARSYIGLSFISRYDYFHIVQELGFNIFLLKCQLQIKPQISFLAKNEANQLVYMNGSDP